MTPLENDLLLRALCCEPVERTPVWIMRQAGRYLPEYRQVREQAGDFMSVCANPDLACEVTMQPLRRYKLDAAILFSDILTVPDAMGLGLYFEAGEGPRFERPVRKAADIRRLKRPDVERSLSYVFEAVRTIRRELNGRVPLIGFAGSPWTVATYMVEGRSSRDFATIKGLAAENSTALLSLLDTVARTTTDYLNAQIDAGALTRHMPEGVRWNEPSGGMFLWVELPAGMDATAVLARAIEQNVAFVPGAPFFAADPVIESLRLAFVTVPPARIEEGVKRLADVIRTQMGQGV
jgi:uroporphyrinogen-III decarboxylase